MEAEMLANQSDGKEAMLHGRDKHKTDKLGTIRSRRMRVARKDNKW